MGQESKDRVYKAISEKSALAHGAKLGWLRDCGRLVGRFTRAMTHASKDPLHGITLEALLTELVAHYGWEELGAQIDIRCFRYDPSIKSSLQFLRKTPWARKKVEDLYLYYKAHS